VKSDLAAEQPKIVAGIEKMMKDEHVPSAIFSLSTIHHLA
jgi:hypothetical protein